MTIINYFLICMGLSIGIFWLTLLYCVFILDYFKDSQQSKWIRKHIITGEDLEPIPNEDHLDSSEQQTKNDL